MITQVHRVYDKRPEVFKFVVISDDFRESPHAVHCAPSIPALQSVVTSDDGRHFKVCGRSAKRTAHPLIWEVLLDVEDMKEPDTTEGEQQWLDSIAKLGDMRVRPEDIAPIVEYAHA